MADLRSDEKKIEKTLRCEYVSLLYPIFPFLCRVQNKRRGL